MKLELKLSNIEFKNFRLFEHIQLHFDDKLTVLISENGAGKTALLEGIANALTVFVEKIKLPSKKVLDLKNIYKNDDIQVTKKQLITNIKVLLSNEYRTTT
jgi:predicted ATP-binding protein involved in virulence